MKAGVDKDSKDSNQAKADAPLGPPVSLLVAGKDEKLNMLGVLILRYIVFGEYSEDYIMRGVRYVHAEHAEERAAVLAAIPMTKRTEP